MSNTSSSYGFPFIYAQDEEEETTEVHEQLKLYSTIDWSKYIPESVSAQKKEPACECGAFKANGLKKGQAGHSTWCPWRK